MHITECQSKSHAGDYKEIKNNVGHIDSYEILGVNRNTPSGEIKRACRKLAGKYRPDKVDH